MKDIRQATLAVLYVLTATFLTACGGGGGGGGSVGANPDDTTAPVVTTFTLPASAASLTVSVSSFTATDNLGVTGYLVTQSATPPAVTNARWRTAPPASVDATGAGSQTFFPWAKDAAGNVSAVAASQTVTIDTTAPVVTAFTLPASAVSLTVSVSSFTATDNLGVTGYLVTQSATPPAVSDARWTTAPPASVDATGAGIKTFFPWAKDAAGNVSAVAAIQTVSIILPPPSTPDTTAPAVTAFTMPPSAASLSVSISAFTATDDVAVTGYMVTQSATPPAATADGWTATAPATVTATAAGIQTFFPWAVDAAGNVSAVETPETVTITLLIPPVSVAVSASGTDTTSAVGADATFTFAAVANVPYAYNISGFGPGDKLVFPVFGGAPNALDIVNPIPTDGIVTAQLIRNVGGDKFDITVVLNGLTTAQDQQITDVASFNLVFGPNSIQ